MRSILKSISSVLFPHLCVCCHQPCVAIADFPGFCRNCLCKVQWIRHSGTGFFWPDQLLNQPLTEERIYGVAFYEEPLRSCLIRFKFHDHMEAADAIAPFMIRTLFKARQPCDALIAVPLHIKRLKQRGYNQTALITSAVCTATGIQDASECLERVRYTRRQTEIENRAERSTNVKDAFHFRHDKWNNHDLKTRHSPVVWLIDDIVTTGATLQEAADPLRRAGFIVNALVLAVNSKGSSLERDHI